MVLASRGMLIALLLLLSLAVQACSPSSPPLEDEVLEELTQIALTFQFGDAITKEGNPFLFLEAEFPIDGSNHILFIALDVPNDYFYFDWYESLGPPADPATSRKSLLYPLRLIGGSLGDELVDRKGFDLLIVTYGDAIGTAIEVPFSDFEAWESGLMSDEQFFSTITIYGGPERPLRGP